MTPASRGKKKYIPGVVSTQKRIGGEAGILPGVDHDLLGRMEGSKMFAVG